MRLPLSLVCFLACGAGFAAELSKVDRTIAKEPKYAGKPKYCLLVFGPEAKHRVWLVQDGGTLYVDRNGNGDLTEPGEKVASRKADGRTADGSFVFDAGELRVGGKAHKALMVSLMPIASLAESAGLMARPNVAEVVKKSPEGMTGYLDLDVECAAIKGGGVGGRVGYTVGLTDSAGVLRLGATPADAPVLHFDGPLQITYYGGKPTWRGGRSEDNVLCVGTPGHGPGTFAMVKYEGTIPEGKYPTIEATYRAKGDSRPPVKERYELKERC